MNYDPSGRIKEISAGVMLPPGLCCVCHTSHGTVFADLDTHIDLWGALYLCDACALGAAVVFGAMSNLEESALRDEIATLKQALESAETRAKRAETLNESYRATILDFRGDGIRGVVDAPVYLADVAPSDSSDDEDSEGDGRRSDEPDDDPVQELGESDGDPPEDSADSAGSADEEDDSVPDSAIERAIEALAVQSGSIGKSPDSSDEPGRESVGRLFGE